MKINEDIKILQNKLNHWVFMIISEFIKWEGAMENYISPKVIRDQGGIFPGKVGKIFPGSIEISQEILMKNHALCRFFGQRLHVSGFFCTRRNIM